ncbi:hypothetical protein EDD15DRAFT_2365600 [Pisolithus albus]|nr:hypothetical protein EDD15DRAFT_2365600 [Pisolithus albus]
MKPLPRSPFEASPRTSKNCPPAPKLASSSPFPLQVTDAGSWHPVAHQARCDHAQQAGDSPSNLLPALRDDRWSRLYSVDCWDGMEDCSPRPQSSSSKPRDLGSSLTSCPHPHELSSATSRYSSRLEPLPRYSPPLETSYRRPSHLNPPSKTSSRHPSHLEPPSRYSLHLEPPSRYSSHLEPPSRHSSHFKPPSRHSLHLKPPSRHPLHSGPPLKTASRHSSHLEHPSGTFAQHPEALSKCPPRLKTPSRLHPRFEACKSSLPQPREASTSTSKPPPAPLESCSRVSRVEELRGTRHTLEGFIFVSSVVEKDTFELSARSALREEIPCPGGLATQVQKSPSSSQTPTPSRACPKVLEGQLPGSRATKPPSIQPLAPSRDQPATCEGRIMSVKVTHPPPSTSETLELDPEAKLTFKQPSRPSG